MQSIGRELFFNSPTTVHPLRELSKPTPENNKECGFSLVEEAKRATAATNQQHVSAKIDPPSERSAVINTSLRLSNKVAPQNISKISAVGERKEFMRKRRINHPAQPLHILVVDDSALHRKLLIKSLLIELQTFQITTFVEVDDGATAIEALKLSLAGETPHIDCILMDYTMDSMHGPQAAKIIRDVLGYKGLVLGVTGNAMADDIAEFVECGADAVVLKPAKIDGLLDVFRTVDVLI